MAESDLRRRLAPLILMPMGEWEMRPAHEGYVGIGIYARSTADGGYCRVWFKWPWECLPNNVVGLADLERCGVGGEFLAYLEKLGFDLEAVSRKADE